MPLNIDPKLIRDLKLMDVPEHKVELTKPQAVKWLLDNLRIRNRGHSSYRTVMLALIEIASGENWIKKGEARAYTLHLDSPVDAPSSRGNSKYVQTVDEAGFVGKEPETSEVKTVESEPSIGHLIADGFKNPKKTNSVLDRIQTRRFNAQEQNLSNVPKSGASSEDWWPGKGSGMEQGRVLRHQGPKPEIRTLSVADVDVKIVRKRVRLIPGKP